MVALRNVAEDPLGDPAPAHIGGRAAAADADDGVKWLALVLAEVFRVALSLIAKRYPEARGSDRCPRCGHRP